MPMRKGYFPYKSPMNLCSIYQFAADNVTSKRLSNITLADLTINVVKNCGLRFITNLPLTRICQSATTKQYHDMPHFYETCQKTY